MSGYVDDGLNAMGVEVSYFDPVVGSDIVDQIRPDTRAIFPATPGSLTFEMPDIAAITAVARPREIITMINNTWATPLYFRPIEHGIDVSIAAATKYLSGHSDVMLGAMTAANADIFRSLKAAARYWGNGVSPED